MDINNEIENANKIIAGLKKDRAFLDNKIKLAYESLNKIVENSKKDGYKKCPCCNKMSHVSEFSKIRTYEKNIECVSQGIINSGENEYAIVEKVNTNFVCPKCNEKFLFNSQTISEGNWLRGDYDFKKFTPIKKEIENRDYTYRELLRKEFKIIENTQDLTE